MDLIIRRPPPPLPPYFKMYLFEKDFENQILCFTEKNKQTFFRK